MRSRPGDEGINTVAESWGTIDRTLSKKGRSSSSSNRHVGFPLVVNAEKQISRERISRFASSKMRRYFVAHKKGLRKKRLGVTLRITYKTTERVVKKKSVPIDRFVLGNGNGEKRIRSSGTFLVDM